MNTFSDRTLLSPSHRELYGGIGCWIAYQLLYPLLASLLLPYLVKNTGTVYAGFLYNALVLTATAVTVVFFFRRFLIASTFPLRENVRRLLLSVLLGLSLYLASAYLLNVLAALLRLSADNSNQKAAETYLTAYPLPYGLCVILLAPVAEEILVRGVIFAPLCKKSPPLAYAVSILVFGGLHLIAGIDARQNAAQLALSFVQYLPAGIFFGWVYQRTRSIYGAICLHMLVNTVSVLQILFF